MTRAMVTAVVLLALAASAGLAGEIGFEEEFALAKDRTVPLKQLIPGTEEYYFYHCLHAQNAAQLDKVEEMLPLWIKRYGHTAQVEEIRNRQALLGYEKDPKKSLEFIRWRLNLQFNHQRELLDKKSDLPTSLPQDLISRDTLTRRAMTSYANLEGFEDRALDWLAAADLNPDRRRDLLRRLQRPDCQNLPRLVVDDLNHEHSRPFGSFAIHRQLLLSQLDECLTLKPDLLNEVQFVNVYLTKLRPNPDVDWRHDPVERQAYLDRLWQFVSRLNPSHNSLKACVLYHRLVHDRELGVYDRDRFVEYVKLPRNIHYVRPEYLDLREHRDYRVNLADTFEKQSLLSPIRTDEELVRTFLMHFFLDADSWKPFDTWIREDYLKRLFAETKIVNGLGDMERWYSMLSPSEYQALKDRVDIDFAFTNRTAFGPDDDVALDLLVKNVKTLIVKVYEINAANYYRANRREVDTDINLDGLVANEEKVHTYDEVPLRRVKRHFDFPALKKRGAYIVEFIGNGKSSRALIRKGQLRFLVRSGPAGHVFTVLDESNRVLKDATLWIDGHEYAPAEAGHVVVPFSTNPGRQAVVLARGDFASLDFFDHQAETYSLAAGFYVDRETLLRRKTAQLVLRPVLYLNGTPVSLSLLEDVVLTITSIDREGISTSTEVRDFKLFEDREALYEFRVPDKLLRISFALRARVKNLSQGKKIDLAAAADFALNRIDTTEKIEDLHLGRISGAYVVDVLGKTGEAQPGRPVAFQLKHRDFREHVHVSLQSDPQGRIALGELKDILSVSATSPEGQTWTWPLVKDLHSYPRILHGKAGAPVYVPCMAGDDKPDRSRVSLLETRDGTFVADRFAALAIAGGLLQIQDLPAGDYDLLLKDAAARITLRVTRGEPAEGYLLADARHLEVRNPKPLQIAALEADDNALRIRLANSSKFARVHVVATRYVPEYSLFDELGAVGFPEPCLVTLARPESVYLAGRDIGDEYRYIIDRKYAARFPGNLLTRPALLLNPWAVRKTETSRQEALAGTDAFGVGHGGVGGRESFGLAKRAPSGPEAGFSALDFLSQQAAVFLNLQPDDNGLVTIDRKDLADHHHVHVLAVDPENTAYRELSLAELKTRFNDLRLVAGLDPQAHFTEQKQVTVLPRDKDFAIADITTSEFETYDTLGKVYRLYMTLSSNPTLAEFAFVLDWPKLKDDEKREKYSKYACHELNFFIYKKDAPFFEKVVLPYLKNKKDKTFLDRWLIGDDLSDCLKPWNFARLNIVERSLLAQRARGEQPVMSRHVKDLFDLIPPNVEEFNRLFTTAIRGSSLEVAPRMQLADALTEAERLKGLAAARPGEPASELRAAAGAEVAALANLGLAVEKKQAKAEIAAPPEEARDAARAEVDGKLADEDKPAAPARKAREAAAFYAREQENRERVRRLYRKLDKTEEWAENNYYHLPIEQQNADLITVNAFWNDYAAHGGQPAFFSTNLAEASRSFPEIMFALAVLDLPFDAPEHKIQYEGIRMQMKAAGPVVLFHKEIKPARPAEEKVPVLVSQNFFRHGDRYRHVNNEQIEKYVTDEFLVHVVYGCHVVVTNPTAARQKLDVLLQVPAGAVPVANGQYTRSVHLDLEPYRTQTFDYYFYFPAPGRWAHYPVHVARNEKLIAAADPVTLNVVEKLTRIDTTSWDYISQHGSPDEVVDYLKQNNLNRTRLDRIAWRMQDKAYFTAVIDLLQARHVYDHTLWSYAVRHDVTGAAREYLQHCDQFVNQCGAFIDTPLLTIDPVLRRAYQHLEYGPLVNARAHKLGKKREIVNDRFFDQYRRLMRVLGYRAALDHDDLMAVTYYLLLQDRVEEALPFFQQVDPKKLATALQYDYFRAYLDFFNDPPKAARAIAKKYEDYPVVRWRNLFANVLSQLDEIEGKAAKVIDEEDRTQTQARLAETEPGFDLKVEAKKITIEFQNLADCLVNYYLMDIELMFSRQPFVQEVSEQFSYIRPNHSETVKLPARARSHTFDLPKQFHSSNVLVEVVAGGVRKSRACYANALAVQVVENYGQVRVAHEKTGKPLPRVYVKVYARMRDGQVRFYKDGYTDLRGKFDYTSLNTNELDFVDRFALLILSETDGAVVREAGPPKR